MNTFNLNVTVSLSPDTLETLNGFLNVLYGQQLEAAETSSIKTAPVKKLEKPAPKEKSNGQAALVVTLEQLRETFTAKGKSSKENKVKCKAILDEYEVTSVSNIPEDKYAEAFQKVNKI